jgi:hypothetical protein
LRRSRKAHLSQAMIVHESAENQFRRFSNSKFVSR